MKRFVWLAAIVGGILVGVSAFVARELQKPNPFPRARVWMNRTMNPALLRLGFVGGHSSHLGTLEHVGRTSGHVYFSPVYPHLEGDSVLIPVPLREHSQWAQNVLAAGRCRLQLHETLYELTRPTLVPTREVAHLAPPVRGVLDRFGWEYLVLHREAEVPGTFATHEGAPARETGLPEPPIEGTFELTAAEAEARVPEPV